MSFTTSARATEAPTSARTSTPSKILTRTTGQTNTQGIMHKTTPTLQQSAMASAVVSESLTKATGNQALGSFVGSLAFLGSATPEATGTQNNARGQSLQNQQVHTFLNQSKQASQNHAQGFANNQANPNAFNIQNPQSSTQEENTPTRLTEEYYHELTNGTPRIAFADMINVLKQKPMYPKEVVFLQEHPDWITKILENNLDVTELMESLKKLPAPSVGASIDAESLGGQDIATPQTNHGRVQAIPQNGELVAFNESILPDSFGNQMLNDDIRREIEEEKAEQIAQDLSAQEVIKKQSWKHEFTKAEEEISIFKDFQEEKFKNTDTALQFLKEFRPPIFSQDFLAFICKNPNATIEQFPTLPTKVEAYYRGLEGNLNLEGEKLSQDDLMMFKLGLATRQFYTNQDKRKFLDSSKIDELSGHLQDFADQRKYKKWKNQLETASLGISANATLAPKNIQGIGTIFVASTAVGVLQDYVTSLQEGKEFGFWDGTKSLGINGVKSLLSTLAVDKVGTLAPSFKLYFGEELGSFTSYMVDVLVDIFAGEKIKSELEDLFNYNKP